MRLADVPYWPIASFRCNASMGPKFLPHPRGLQSHGPDLGACQLPSDQRGRPIYRAFLRKVTHCTLPGLTNDRFGLPAPPIIMVKACFRPGLPVCDLENTYFRSPFWLDIGISQTKSGSSLLTRRD